MKTTGLDLLNEYGFVRTKSCIQMKLTKALFNSPVIQFFTDFPRLKVPSDCMISLKFRMVLKNIYFASPKKFLKPYFYDIFIKRLMACHEYVQK